MNKKISVFLILIIAILFFFGYAQEKTSVGAKIINKMTFSKINFKVPQIEKDVERYVLPNGMVFLIKEDKSVPVIKIDALIRVGKIYENKEKLGAGRLCAACLIAGGTKNYTPEEINKTLDYKSIIIGFSQASEYTVGYLNALNKDFDEALSIFADALMQPSFDKEKFETEKMKVLDSIARQKDNPSALSYINFTEFIYNGNPRGWQYKEDVVKKITIEDLSAWHDKYYAPNNIIMAISGDFKSSELKEKLNNIFGHWRPKEIEFPKVAVIVEDDKKSCLIIDKQFPQAFINMGNISIKNDNPDLVPITIMNQILGAGSLTDRLNLELRVKKGLTYGVQSGFDLYGFDKGFFDVSYSTKTASTYESINIVLDIINQLREKGVTDAELKQAKEAEINRFIFGLTPISEVLAKLADLEYYNLPRDFYVNYIKNVEKVSKEDILRCARTYLHPEKIKIVIVGNGKEFKADVEKLIPITK